MPCRDTFSHHEGTRSEDGTGSALRAVLINSDILPNIFQYFNPSPSLVFNYATQQENKANLARLATVCKAFADAALDILWRELPDDGIPLLLTLPAFRGLTFSPWTRQLILPRVGVVPREDWTLFCNYCRRIRKIDLYHYGILLVPVLGQLAEDNNCHVLFPSAKDMWWGSQGEKLQLPRAVCLLLVPPTLSRFSMWLTLQSATDEAIMSFVGALVDRAPLLRELHLDVSGSNKLEFPLLPIARLIRLRHLGIHGIASAGGQQRRIQLRASDFYSLSSLIELESLNIDAGLSAEPQGLVLFPQLRCLTIGGFCHAGSTLRLIRAIHAPSLQSFKINSLLDGIHTETLRVHLHDCISAVAAWSPTSLRDVHLRHHGVMHGPTVDPLLSVLTIVRPLLPIATLERVSLSGSDNIHLTDADLLQMASAWPRLRHLYIRYTVPEPLEWSLLPTVTGLAHLARLCPDLEALRVWQFNVWDGWEAVEHTILYSREKMRVLEVRGQWQPVRQPLDSHVIARVLHRLYPRLSLLASVFDSEEADGKWNEICEIMANFQSGTESVAENET